MKFKPVKTAVIGAGMISGIYLENLKNRFSIIDLVGVSDLVDAKAQAQAEKYGIRKMTNEEILSDPEIELVLNLTYASAHYEVSKSILEAGKHCYSEKMMCLTLEEAAELDRIRREKNVMFTVAPDTFLGSSQQSSRYYIDMGIIGKPLHADIALSRGYFMLKSDADDAYRKYSVVREGGGIPYDMGGYYLHQLFNLFGPARRVCGFCDTHAANRPYLNPRHSSFEENFFVNTPNRICASMKFDNDITASMYISSEHKVTENSFKIYGTEGNIEIGDPNDFDGKITLSLPSGTSELPLTHPFASNSRGVGAAEMAWSLRLGRKSRLTYEMSYHALELIEAVRDCTSDMFVKELKTDFERPAPISRDAYGGDCEERSLYL
ncbi:MAG: Gfo/Idh/MocA family oxidoreductase [Clostridia bacterium]|nr:Gfo/Idh/MocA family oxidoreductase [Clostridia bacterium]